MGQIYQMFRTVAKTGKLVASHAEEFGIIKRLTEEAASRLCPDR